MWAFAGTYLLCWCGADATTVGCKSPAAPRTELSHSHWLDLFWIVLVGSKLAFQVEAYFCACLGFSQVDTLFFPSSYSCLFILFCVMAFSKWKLNWKGTPWPFLSAWSWKVEMDTTPCRLAASLQGIPDLGLNTLKHGRLPPKMVATGGGRKVRGETNTHIELSMIIPR